MGAASPTPTLTPSRTPSITPTISITRTVSATPSVTRTVSATPSVTITASPTPTPSRYAEYDYILYLADDMQFNAAEVSVGTTGLIFYSMAWEYWNGTTWNTLNNIQETVLYLSNFETTTPGTVYWDTPGNWVASTVNGSGPYYWVRVRSYTVNGMDDQAILNYIRPTIPPSPTPSITPSTSISNTPSITPTISISRTPSITPSITITRTPSITPTISISNTPSITISPSITPSITPSISISATPSITPSITPTISISKTPSISISKTPSITPTISISNTPSITPSITITATPSITPSITISPSPIDCSVIGGSAIIVPPPTPSITISTTPTSTPSITPTKTPTPTPSRSATAPGTISLIYSNAASGTARVNKNGVSYLTRTTVGTTNGTINTGDTFNGNIVLSTSYNAAITISSTTRGIIYDNSSLTGGLTSTTFTREAGENISVNIASYAACFIEGTLITLPDGQLVPIETLKDSDILLSEKIIGLDDTNNVNKLYEWTSNIINTTSTTSVIESITMHKADSTIIINNGLLQATKYHNQLIQRDDEWKFIPFCDIKVGDNLLSINGEIIIITSIEIDETERTIYKITLSDESHTYYANNILTHNVK